MVVKKSSLIYFSPTGGTKRAGSLLANGLAEQVEQIDLGALNSELQLSKGMLAIIASPVFGGRVPDFAMQKLKLIKGNGGFAITIAVYGNRAFDDAILELNDSLAEQGFSVIASVAMVAEHSMVRAVASGRPDKQDEIQIQSYADRILQKLGGGKTSFEDIIPGKRPFVEWKPMPVMPITSDNCTGCGVCAKECPVGAISMKNPKVTSQACILCMRCISICPQNSRSLPPPAQAMIEQKLLPIKKIRRENELFL